MNKKTSVLSAAALAIAAFANNGSGQSDYDFTPPATYRMPTVTIYGSATNELQGITQAANAVTVLSGEQIRPGSITTTRELGTYLPNVTVFDANNDRTPKFSVRGLRENNFAAGEPAIGFYVDDIPYTDLNSRGLALFDVEQIEFLRGPQSSLFGASGPGGVVNVVTRQPGDTWEGRAGFAYGNYNSQTYDAAVRGPIIAETLSLGVSGIYSTRDGFVRNVMTGSRMDDKETLGGRAQLRWTPTDTLDFSLIVHGQQFNDGFVPTYFPRFDPSPFRVRRDFEGHVDTDTWGVALKGSFQNELLKVTSVTSYRNWQQDLLQDFAFSPTLKRLGFNNPELNQWSEEFRVQSNDPDQPLQWLGGLYFSHSDAKNDSGSVDFTIFPLDFPPPTTYRTLSENENSTYAVFGQATYTIGEKLDLTAGLRFSYEDRSMDRGSNLENPFYGTIPISSYSVSDEFTDLSPRFGASYQVTDAIETYASVRRGFQSGGFNAANNNPAMSRYDSSHSWHYEIGAKSKFLEDRLFVNAAVFYSDYDDYQTYRINPFNPIDAYMINAENVRSYGAEVDATIRPVQGLELSAAAGVTKAEFREFAGIFDGNDVNFVPEFTANIAVQYRLSCGFYARVEVQGLGDYWLDEANTAKQSAFGLVNARLGYENKHFEVYLFGRNLLDKEYTNNALDLRWALQPDLLVRQPGDPMTFGIAIAGKF
ncbi:MAG: TonB-dependent receptor [Verrucomicrobia bacterium]|nr:TonB-dependent receptor [Verrucomicrobiota bacterium]